MFFEKHFEFFKTTAVPFILCLIFQLSMAEKVILPGQKLTEENPAFASSNQEDVNLNTLQMVQVVFRHGDRAPITVYPTDPYKDVQKYWPQGLGQLTEKGMDQQYDLGSYFRQRYDGFLSSLYSPKQIHVLSSDVDRTIMSAEANAAGLFPKLNHSKNGNSTDDSHGKDAGQLVDAQASVEGSKVGVQLVPIHTLPNENDKLLKMSAECPRKDQALAEYQSESEDFLKLQNENQDLIKYMEENMGISPFTKDMFSILKMHDPLLCQKAHNLTLPAWATDEVMDRIEKLRGIGFSMDSGTTELKRLQGGPLVAHLLSNMLSVQVQNQDEIKSKKLRSIATMPKMYVHSAHDDTLAAVMSSMGVFDPQIPSYASAFIVELHLDEGNYFVNLFYRNSSQSAYPLQVPGCDFNCPLNTLVTLLEPITPLDWEKECLLRQEGYAIRVLKTGASISDYFLCLLGIASVVLIICSLINFPRIRNQIFNTASINSKGLYMEI